MVAGTTLVIAGLLIAVVAGTLAHRAARYAPAGAVAMAELILWLAVVTRDWVKVPAEAYAERLMEAVDPLDPAE